jgi:plastocyanin
MKKKGVIIASVIILVLAAGYLFTRENSGTSTTTEVTGEPSVTIVRTNDGYEPSEVTIKKGDIILWTNESDEYHWPASDLHPTHGVYPEFDPLTPLAPAEDWKFQFNQVGDWKFHDHIRANKLGTVTVTE